MTLVSRAKTQNVKCVVRPNRARITCRKVLSEHASGKDQLYVGKGCRGTTRMQESLGSRSVKFELHGQHGKEQDLDRCSRRVPERAADAVLHSHRKCCSGISSYIGHFSRTVGEVTTPKGPIRDKYRLDVKKTEVVSTHHHHHDHKHF